MDEPGGRTIYATLMERGTFKLKDHIADVIHTGLSEARATMIDAMAEDLREAYLAGHADGFREGVAAESERWSRSLR